MNDELFDEPRKCPTCKVVTYCDNCPVCGRGLARSSKQVWNLKHRHDVAGEEGSGNDLKHERIEERILETIHRGNNTKFTERDDVTQSKPSAGFDQKNTRRNNDNIMNEEQFTIHSLSSIVSKVVLVIVLILILCGFIGYIAKSKILGTLSQLNSVELVGNSTEIIIDDITYSSRDKKNTISMSNMGDKAYYGSIMLYDKNSEFVGEYKDLGIFPYESFEVEIHSTKEATSFEIEKEKLYTLKTDAPNFAYSTFNDYGYLTVYLRKDISQSELEILVKHMYEVSLINEQQLIFGVDVKVDGDLYYNCYVNNENESVNVSPSEDAVLIQDMYEFKLVGNSVENDFTKDVAL